MNRIMQKGINVVNAFAMGFSDTFWNGTTFAIAGAIGFQQGMKYTGSLKRGLFAAGITAGVIGVAGGILTVASNSEYIGKNKIA